MPDSYPLPPIVYLPSSGGYTSSRIASEVRRFFLRQRPVIGIGFIAYPDSRPPEIPFPPLQHRRRRKSCLQDPERNARCVSVQLVQAFGLLTLSPTRTQPSRPKPYDRPSPKPAPHPSRRSPPPPTTRGDNGSSASDAAAQLLTSLVPTIMGDPEALESSLSSICAAHNVDSAIAASLVRAVRENLESPDDETLNER